MELCRLGICAWLVEIVLYPRRNELLEQVQKTVWTGDCNGAEVLRLSRRGRKRMGCRRRGRATDDIRTASAIAYPAVVELFPRPSIKAVPGPVECGPVE